MGIAAGSIYGGGRGNREKGPGVLIQLLENPKKISALAYSPCGTWIASGSIDETFRLWHRQSEEDNTWSCVSVVRGFFGFIQNIAWNPVVPMEFVTACQDGSVRVKGVSPGVSGKDVNKWEGVEVRFLGL